MSGYYLTEMATWLRQAGLDVKEYSGWKQRARSSGGYSDKSRPWCVMWHHTASPAHMDGYGDASYCAEGDEDAPLANAYIDRTGLVWCLAAGCTNTNGSGNATKFSKGTVPANSMNSYAFGVEMGNNGSGEPWPEVQINSMFLVSNTINSKLGNKPDDVCTHQRYAPDRKIDPATAAAVKGSWKPSSCTSAGTWDCADVKHECLRRFEDEDMPLTDQEIKKIAEAVWNHPLKGDQPEENKPAGWRLRQIQGMVRNYLGGWKETTEVPDNTLLKQIHQNTKK